MPRKKGVFRTRHKVRGKWVYAKRNPDGTFKDIQNIGRAIKINIPRKAKAKVKPGHGFRGDIKK